MPDDLKYIVNLYARTKHDFKKGSTNERLIHYKAFEFAFRISNLLIREFYNKNRKINDNTFK